MFGLHCAAAEMAHVGETASVATLAPVVIPSIACQRRPGHGQSALDEVRGWPIVLLRDRLVARRCLPRGRAPSRRSAGRAQRSGRPSLRVDASTRAEEAQTPRRQRPQP